MAVALLLPSLMCVLCLYSCTLPPTTGHLTNLSELVRRNGKGSPKSPGYSADINNASSLERKSSIERSMDLGATTASLVLNMYLDEQQDGNEVIMLSELQVGAEERQDGRVVAVYMHSPALAVMAVGLSGCLPLEIEQHTNRSCASFNQGRWHSRSRTVLSLLLCLQGEFAFVIYDNKRKQAFAARDPSGDEPLFYHITEDGDVSFAGSRLAVPDGEQPHEWRELPPGHYISGKNPKLYQFALTPHQLAMREIQQEDELESSFRSSRFGARPSLLAAVGPDEQLHVTPQRTSRASLDNDSLIRRKSVGLDSDVFSLDL